MERQATLFLVTRTSWTKSALLILYKEKRKRCQRGFCIEQGVIPPRGDIQHRHVTFTWCDDNVPHQVTKHIREHIVLSYKRTEHSDRLSDKSHGEREGYGERKRRSPFWAEWTASHMGHLAVTKRKGFAVCLNLTSLTIKDPNNKLFSNLAVGQTREILAWYSSVVRSHTASC
jgi:hypothetical protein